MRILALTNGYPYPNYPFLGIFNERCILALKEFCEEIDVVVPRPYVPNWLAVLPALQVYSAAPRFEIRNGIRIHRPPRLWIPRFASSLLSEYGAFWGCLKLIRAMHRKKRYDIILSFDLHGGGTIAWRAARDLGIPACGWAFGGDVRMSPKSFAGKAVIRAIENLNLIFYQSTELLQEAGRLVSKPVSLLQSNGNKVLPHGIPRPQKSLGSRRDKRGEWGITEKQLVVLYLGRLTEEKGVNDLLKAVEHAAQYDSRITCALVGAMPAVDESDGIKRAVAANPILRNRVRIFSACDPDEIWENLRAADIFGFASHHEGIPNALLEAMAVGLPLVSFAIPAITAVDSGTDSLLKVPPFDTRLFGEAILTLAKSSHARKSLGEKGKKLVFKNYDIQKNMHTAIQEMSAIL